MLKKFSSNKIFSLTENEKNNKTIEESDNKTKNKVEEKSKKNLAEKNDSKAKNSILRKDILKSISITPKNNNKEQLLFNSKNSKNKISQKNEDNAQKRPKNKNHLNTKIKTAFSNYYTYYIFKNHSNQKQINNVTDVTYKEETEELSHIQINPDLNMNEKTLKAHRLKPQGLYNTDSSHKINFNLGTNPNISKDYSLNKKESLIISPERYKRVKIDKKKENSMNNSNNSNLKVSKFKKRKIVGNSKNVINKKNNNNMNININHSNNNSNKKHSNSNKNPKKYKEVYQKNKNIIKQKKTNNLLNNNKKQNLKKNTEKYMERNKNNNITEYESQIQNENLNKVNFINAKKHIFLSPMIKKKNNEKNKLSPKKLNKPNHNNIHQYNGVNGVSNKEIKKIFFKYDVNHVSKNKVKEKIVNEYQFQNKLLENLDENYNNMNTINKENSSSLNSEDNKTEKDFNLEKNERAQNRATANGKQLKDYFRIARKVLKNASHSLVESIKDNNNFLEQFKNKNTEAGQITNRNKEKEEDSFNYTIKKVPVFSGVNMFPRNDESRKKLRYNNNILYKLLINNNNDNNNNKTKKSIVNFLDIKSVIILSSINKDFYKYLRSAFYNFIYNKIYKNKNIKLIKKVNNSLIKSVYLEYKSDIYEKISTQSQYLDIILNDIARTFPKNSKFKKEGKYYNKLYNVLTKYSNYDKNIGYAQGLNFMFANALLLYENEKEAFFYINGLIKKFSLDKFFAEKNSKLIEEIGKYSKILEKYTPDIVNFFNKKHIYHEFFSTGWILTLFSNVMDTKNLFIVWNFMIIYGWKFFYSLVIEILRFYKDTIFHTNENDLNHLMKNLLKDEKFSINLPNILKNTFNFMQRHILL